jgi:DNA repair ATPase RecN
VKAGRTVTEVARLDGVEREQELARMIAGSGTSAAVMASAREMLEARRVANKKRR